MAGDRAGRCNAIGQMSPRAGTGASRGSSIACSTRIKLTAHGRSHLAEFSEAIRSFPEVLDCFVLLGTVDFMLRIVARDIESYERFFFDKLSQVPGIQEVNSMVALSEIKSTTALSFG